MKQEYEKVLEYLRSCTRSATPNEITHATRLDTPVVFKALVALKEEGYVKPEISTEPLGTETPRPSAFFAVSDAELQKARQREKRRKERKKQSRQNDCFASGWYTKPIVK